MDSNVPFSPAVSHSYFLPPSSPRPPCTESEGAGRVLPTPEPGLPAQGSPAGWAQPLTTSWGCRNQLDKLCGLKTTPELYSPPHTPPTLRGRGVRSRVGGGGSSEGSVAESAGAPDIRHLPRSLRSPGWRALPAVSASASQGVLGLLFG